MKVGQTIETGIWLTGTESDDIRKTYERDVIEIFDYLCHENKVIHGPVKWTEKLPGTDRVPKVPDWAQGPYVRLLVAETDIVAKAPEVDTRAFIGELEDKDLARLRYLTRRAHKQKYPYATDLTDDECDDIIEEIGPEAAVQAIRDAVNAGAVH